MSRMQRDKGTRAEVEEVAYLRANGWPDARRYLAGDGNQPGDVDGIPGVCIEVKNVQELRVNEWLDQAEAEARGRLPLVVVRRPRLTDPGDWWAIARQRHLLPLLRSEA